jgi:hypothetical protein
MPTLAADLATLIPRDLYAPQARQLLSATRTELAAAGRVLPPRHALDALLRGVAASHDLPAVSLFSMLRAVVAWPAAAPDLFEVMQLLGVAEVVARIDAALLRLSDVA